MQETVLGERKGVLISREVCFTERGKCTSLGELVGAEAACC